MCAIRKGTHIARRQPTPLKQVWVRLRITRKPEGTVDGIRLDDFMVGSTYEVGTTIGSYLLAQGVAEPAAEDDPALLAPCTETRFAIIGTSDTEPPGGETAPDAETTRDAADRRKR